MRCGTGIGRTDEDAMTRVTIADASQCGQYGYRQSKIDDLTLTRRDRAGTRVICLGGEGIHEIVIMRGIVMK